jgi:putative ABC transport system permease protein
VSGGTEPERIDGRLVSTGLFPMLGVQPRLGRGFGDDDGRPGSAPVAIVSEDVWKRRYGGDPDVLSRDILLNDDPYTIVGVMPRRFQLHGDAEAVYLPYHLRANESDTTTGGFYGVGRLAPGVAQADAQQLVDAVGLPLESEAPLPGTWALRVTPKKVARVNDTTRTALFVLLGAVGFVLLITCANVANMFLSQTAPRQREMAVRSAIGAPRWRLVREVLTESFLLAAAGGLLGIVLAHWGVQALVAAAPANLAFQATSPVEIDGRVLGVSAVLILLTGFLFGIVPAIRGSRPNLEGTLRGAAGRPASSRCCRSSCRSGRARSACGWRSARGRPTCCGWCWRGGCGRRPSAWSWGSRGRSGCRVSSRRCSSRSSPPTRPASRPSRCCSRRWPWPPAGCRRGRP